MPTVPTEAAQQTLSVLRDGSHFSWHVITLFVLVVYVYTNEIAKQNFRGVFAGLAFLAADLFNETWNGLFFHFSGRAPVWGVQGDSAYVLLIGLNVEIVLMFAVAGIAATKGLPDDPAMRIAGLPNRWFFALFWSAISVGVECVLNALGVLSWEQPWWNTSAPYLIFLVGYLPFFAVAYWVHDMRGTTRQALTVAALLGFDAVALTTFGSLGWI